MKALLGKTLSNGRSSPREVIPLSLDVLSPPPSSGSGGRENEKSRKLESVKTWLGRESRVRSGCRREPSLFSMLSSDHCSFIDESMNRSKSLI